MKVLLFADLLKVDFIVAELKIKPCRYDFLSKAVNFDADVITTTDKGPHLHKP